MGGNPDRPENPPSLVSYRQPWPNKQRMPLITTAQYKMSCRICSPVRYHRQGWYCQQLFELMRFQDRSIKVHLQYSSLMTAHIFIYYSFTKMMRLIIHISCVIEKLEESINGGQAYEQNLCKLSVLIYISTHLHFMPIKLIIY